MTIKEIIKICSGDVYMVHMQRIHFISRYMCNMTENEKKEAEREIRRLAKMIQMGAKN